MSQPVSAVIEVIRRFAVEVGTTVVTGESDRKVKASVADTTPNFLDQKLAAGNGIDINITNPGGNESLEIEVEASGVVAGSYTNASVTILADGRVSAAANGSGGVAGSDKQVQYNDDGALGGAAGLLYDKASGAVEVVAQGAAYTPLVIVAENAQSANLQEWQNDSNTLLSAVGAGGNVGVRASPDASYPLAVGAVSNLVAKFAGVVVLSGVRSTSDAFGLGNSSDEMTIFNTKSSASIGVYTGSAAKLAAVFSGHQGPNALYVENATTNIATTILALRHNSTNTPNAGFGTTLAFQAESSTTENATQAQIASSWVTATHASRVARLSLSAFDTDERVVIKIEGGGTGGTGKLGFHSAAAIEAPTWAAWSGTANRSGLNTATATTAQVAQTVKALIDDLLSYGLFKV